MNLKKKSFWGVTQHDILEPELILKCKLFHFPIFHFVSRQTAGYDLKRQRTV